jgi:N-acetyl-anhydromuramyl-L-alanine amidase AmpD
VLFVVAAVALAAQTPVAVVPRAAWDPDPPRLVDVTRYPKPLRRSLRFIVVHHSDFLDPPGPLGIKEYHLQVSGFADIGYHFVVGVDGTVYEARPVDRMGAHAGQSREANRGVVAARKTGGDVDRARRFDPDHGAIGIVVDGYFQDAPPPPAQTAALHALIERLRADYDIAADHVITHREVKAKLVVARGLTFASEETTCPGDALHAAVVLLRVTSPAATASRAPRPPSPDDGPPGG